MRELILSQVIEHAVQVLAQLAGLTRDCEVPPLVLAAEADMAIETINVLRYGPLG